MCRLLSATGISGMPDSHFHSPSVADWMGYYNIAQNGNQSEYDLLTAIFESARVRGAGDTGMFGLRLQRASFNFFMQKLSVLCPGCSSDFERIQRVFGRTLFVHLTRENKLDQAISYVMATQTGLWHRAPDGTELERLSAPKEPFYDAAAIAGILSKLTAMDTSWHMWFAKENIDPLCIRYRDLSADPLNVIGELLEHLGLDRQVAHRLELPVAKLADATNRLWAERFLAENPSC